MTVSLCLGIQKLELLALPSADMMLSTIFFVPKRLIIVLIIAIAALFF